MGRLKVTPSLLSGIVSAGFLLNHNCNLLCRSPGSIGCVQRVGSSFSRRDRNATAVNAAEFVDKVVRVVACGPAQGDGRAGGNRGSRCSEAANRGQGAGGRGDGIPSRICRRHLHALEVGPRNVFQVR